MEESDGAAQRMTAEEHHREFPYDERPVHPTPTEVSPLEGLAGRGQTEGTPMGLGQGLSWVIIGVIALVFLVSLVGYLMAVPR
jgi:hypothetical protein